ncbi:MAG: DUF6320 domain-containing protein [Bacillota bacterium]
MEQTQERKETLRKRFNTKKFILGNVIQISLVQLISLLVINISLVLIIINFFIKGPGIWEWWSAYVTAGLIFSYLILRVFTSTGIVLGRQVTWLITVFNLFFNLFKVLGIVESDQYWELTFLIPMVNLLCLIFLVFVFAIRKKKFRAIIIPSLKITLVSVIPIARLYIAQGSEFSLPIFNSIVLILAFSLFINSLVLNWLTIKRVTEENIEKIKNSASNFKKAGDKVANVNKKLESVGRSFGKFKSFWVTSGQAFKEFFTYRKKDKILIASSSENGGEKLMIDNKKNEHDKKSILKTIKKLATRKKQADIDDDEKRELVMSDIDNEGSVSSKRKSK